MPQKMPQKMRYGLIVYLEIPADVDGALPVYSARVIEHMVLDALESQHKRIEGTVDCELLSTEVIGMGLPSVQPCVTCAGRGTWAIADAPWMRSCSDCKGTGAQP